METNASMTSPAPSHFASRSDESLVFCVNGGDWNPNPMLRKSYLRSSAQRPIHPAHNVRPKRLGMDRPSRCPASFELQDMPFRLIFVAHQSPPARLAYTFYSCF
ncbi:hypothetical protein PMIN06_008457 [Paraphaeosphaeria minitans]